MIMPANPEILAVDDTPDNLFLLEAMLGDPEPYRLTCVESGEAALEVVMAAPPDLILLDVRMPGMSGYEVTRRIRQTEARSHIPILLITADEQASEEIGEQAGANGLIRKPFEMDELIASIQSLLE